MRRGAIVLGSLLVACTSVCAADPDARRALESQSRRGDALARGFVDELRERERLEAREREERLRREREKELAKPAGADEWMPPWGWPGPPGLARPKTKIAK